MNGNRYLAPKAEMIVLGFADVIQCSGELTVMDNDSKSTLPSVNWVD